MINCNSKADSFPKKIQGLIEKAESNGDFAWRGFLVKKGMTFRKAQDDIMDGTPFSAVEFSIESAEPICAFDIFDFCCSVCREACARFDFAPKQGEDNFCGRLVGGKDGVASSVPQRRACRCRVRREDAESQVYLGRHLGRHLGRYLGRRRDRQRLLCPRHPE